MFYIGLLILIYIFLSIWNFALMKHGTFVDGLVPQNGVICENFNSNYDLVIFDSNKKVNKCH